jgi:hypothetical protein
LARTFDVDTITHWCLHSAPQEERQMGNKVFEPSSEKLLAMIRSAEAKFDADREQATMRAEAMAERRMARAWEAEVAARHRLEMWGER